ncbi:RNA polymerase sigma factor [Stenotrophomonas bentonitica]|uniref:RNA polymerase sigma factor n=1 Tax=Stenotrophomonas bentonitica TaxID=1450134 RepID=UPI003A742848
MPLPTSADLQSILREHWPMLSRLAYSYTPDIARRDDLLQEVSIAVWQALPRWRGEGSLRAFIARVAHNRSVDVLATEQRLSARVLDDGWPDPNADPLRHAEAQQQRDELLSAVISLPLGYRQVVSLALEGFSHREISDALGLEENAVAQRLSRARRQLRDLMGASP